MKTIFNIYDDFLVVDPPPPHNSCKCQYTLSSCFDICTELGVHIEDSKTFYPTTCLPYLGFIADSDLLELRLPREKQEKVLSLLSHWSEGRPGTKRELLPLVGFLQHCTQAILLGPPFLHRLIDHAHSVKRIHHYVKLSTWGKDDIQWWFQLISKWNGKSLFIYFQVGSRALIFFVTFDAA